MTVTSKRERALQVVLVALGLLTAGADIYPLVPILLFLREGERRVTRFTLAPSIPGPSLPAQ